MPKKLKKNKAPSVHKELEGYEIKVDELGNLKSNIDIDVLNTFLNDKVEDKKLKNTTSEEE